ncbi:unnamed protein product [Dracunculus medinensis]|uniref:Ras-associating domain-containing protein n=1 Tax=Dracunculus medinensis TaxID=318479 RepID=A0A0N4UBH1_DRAME|nr:unnamed protein product [Dracunculus medinensis]
MEIRDTEIRLLYIGAPQKNILFEKIRATAIKCEKHVTYADTFYLKYNIDGEEVTVELFDPGLEHTGAREMGIQRAHGAILVYSACSTDSLQWITEIPIVLISIEDNLTDGLVIEKASVSQSSTSENYEFEDSPLNLELTPKRIVENSPTKTKVPQEKVINILVL